MSQYTPSSQVRQLSYLGLSNFKASKGFRFGLHGAADEFHFGLVRGAAALAHIARQAGADDVFPGGHSPAAARNHVVEAQLMDGEVPAAVLARVSVAGQDVAAIQVQVLLGEAVVGQAGE